MKRTPTDHCVLLGRLTHDELAEGMQCVPQDELTKIFKVIRQELVRRTDSLGIIDPLDKKIK